MTTARGAGLMLVPVVLGLGGYAHAAHGAHPALLKLAGRELAPTLIAAAVHTVAMVPTGARSPGSCIAIWGSLCAAGRG